MGYSASAAPTWLAQGPLPFLLLPFIKPSLGPGSYFMYVMPFIPQAPWGGHDLPVSPRSPRRLVEGR